MVFPALALGTLTNLKELRALSNSLRPAARSIPLEAGPVKGLTLVHFSAQRKRFLWDRWCIQGLFKGCSGGMRRCSGALRVYFVSETAQVELKSGRV